MDESIVHRVRVYVGSGAACGGDCLCAVWFPSKEQARSFAEAMLWDIYRELVVGRGDPRRFWCELASGRRLDGEWRPVGRVGVARLDSERGEVGWAGSPALPRPRAGLG